MDTRPAGARFPSTYGRAPPTLETFLRRNKPSQPGPGQTEGIPHMDDDEIARRITVLEQRHAHLSDPR
ncbi:hypothetical protein [uncultured Tateyamaria sp.]|uniref:hypothetical protein n=1 Tax=uncultured Tateyamaria sp. TaxID=455651 RepID=UPI00260A4A9F|nr:hypothetical protein [uncultured Tateyamaria sp.]